MKARNTATISSLRGTGAMEHRGRTECYTRIVPGIRPAEAGNRVLPAFRAGADAGRPRIAESLTRRTEGQEGGGGPEVRPSGQIGPEHRGHGRPRARSRSGRRRCSVTRTIELHVAHLSETRRQSARENAGPR